MATGLRVAFLFLEQGAIYFSNRADTADAGARSIPDFYPPLGRRRIESSRTNMGAVARRQVVAAAYVTSARNLDADKDRAPFQRIARRVRNPVQLAEP
jgi:hypothetical protein